MSNLVIVAAGEGTRLLPYTKTLPKLLIEVDGRTALDHIVAAWDSTVDRSLIICRSEHLAILSHYCARHLRSFDISFRTHDTVDGSANALFSGTEGLLPFSSDVFVTWSDLWPKCRVDLPWPVPDCVVYTDPSVPCRYNISKGILSEDTGHVVGIFHFTDLYRLDEPTPGEDLVDLIARSDVTLEEGEISVRDFGDHDKLKDTTSKQPQARSFNKLTFTPTKVIKEPTNMRGWELLRKEATWYREVGPKPYLPKVVEQPTHLELEILDALPLQMVYSDTHLTTLLSILVDLHTKTQDSTLEKRRQQAHIEYIVRTRARLNEVRYLIPEYDENKVNYLLSRAEAFLLARSPLDDRLCLIHGDCQFSNTLVSKDGQVYLIDPRGYFGNNHIYGLPEYDYVKVAYALSGYDDFNTCTTFSDETKIVPKQIPEKLRKLVGPRIDVLVALTWLKLTAYLPNNLLKMQFAYTHGMKLLEQALTQNGYIG